MQSVTCILQSASAGRCDTSDRPPSPRYCCTNKQTNKQTSHITPRRWCLSIHSSDSWSTATVLCLCTVRIISPSSRLNALRYHRTTSGQIDSGRVGVPARATRVYHRRRTIAETRPCPTAAWGRSRGHTPHRPPRDRPCSKAHVRIHGARPPPPDGPPSTLQITVPPVELWRAAAAATAPLVADGSCYRRAEGGVQEAHGAPENSRELQREYVARHREEEQGR